MRKILLFGLVIFSLVSLNMYKEQKGVWNHFWDIMPSPQQQNQIPQTEMYQQQSRKITANQWPLFDIYGDSTFGFKNKSERYKLQKKSFPGLYGASEYEIVLR